MISAWAKMKIWWLGKTGAIQALDEYLTTLEMEGLGHRSRLDKTQKKLLKAYIKRTRKRWIGDKADG